MEGIKCYLRFFSIFLVIICISSLEANARINQDKAMELCGINSTNEQKIITEIRKAKSEKNLNKIFGCGALALSVENNLLDQEAAQGFLAFYNIVDNSGKKLLIDFLNANVFDPAILRESNLLGALFALFLNDNYNLFDEKLQEEYTTTLFSLAGLWVAKDNDMSSFGHYLFGQIYLSGQGVEQNYKIAKDEFAKSIKTYQPSSFSEPSMSRAKFCWLTTAAAWAADSAELKSGVSECMNVLNGKSSELGALQIAAGSLSLAVLLADDQPAATFWKEIYEMLHKPGVSVGSAQNYINNRCRGRDVCALNYLYQTLALSTSIYETSFISASLLDRVKVQASLKMAGYYGGEIDGLWGNLTQKAIRNFAQSANSPVFKVQTLNDRLLETFPVSEDRINYYVQVIYRKIKQKENMKTRNYRPSYKPNSSNRYLSNFRIDLRPQRTNIEPFLTDFSPFTNIYVNGGWINCYTGGGFTTCQ